MWDALLAATALMLVIEGIWPFLSPEGFRKSLIMLIQMEGRALRIAGFFSMMLGLLILYWVK